MNEYLMNWYYLERGSWIGPITDEEKMELIKWGVHPHDEEELFPEFSGRRDVSETQRYRIGYVEKEDNWKRDEKNRDDDEMDEDLEITDEEDWDEEDEGSAEEDVLAVASDDSFFDLADISNVESSEEDFDELAVLPNWNVEDDSRENEDILAVDDSAASNELNRSDEKKDGKYCFEDQTKRFKGIEAKLEKVCLELDVFSAESNNRLGALEEKTVAFSENCEKLGADFQSLSIKVSSCITNDWNSRFNDQAEGLAITREKITGVNNKIEREVRNRNIQLGGLNEKIRDCEQVSQDVATRVDSLETSVQDLETVAEELQDKNSPSEEDFDDVVGRVEKLEDFEKELKKFDFENLSDSLRNVEVNVNNFKSELSTVSGSLGNVEINVGNLESELSNVSQGLDSIVTSTNLRFDAINKSNDNLGESVAKLQNKRYPSETRIKKIETNLENFATSLEEQKQYLLEQTNRTSEAFNLQVVGLTGKVEETQNKLQGLEASVRNYSDSLESLREEQKRYVLEQVSQKLSVRVDSVFENVASLEKNFDAQKRQLLLEAARLGELEELLNDLKRLAGNNVQEQRSMTQEIEFVRSNVAEQENDVADVRKDVGQINSTLDNIQEWNVRLDASFQNFAKTLEELSEEQRKNVLERSRNQSEISILTRRLEEIQNSFQTLESSIKASRNLFASIDSKITNTVEQVLSKQCSIETRLEELEKQTSIENDVKAVVFALIIVCGVVACVVLLFVCAHYFWR